MATETTTEADEDAEAERLLAEAAAEVEDGAETEDAETGAEADAALGDAGKKAIDAMKAKWQKERDDRKRLQAELEALKKPKTTKDDGTPDADAIRADAERAATAKVNERIIRTEVRAAATGKLHDPKDALAYLDLSKFEVDEDGNVDESEIADAIDDLLKRKPYLGVTQGDEKRFKGTADGGARGKAGKPQLTEADVKKLAAEGKHAEIEQARVDGRLNELLGIK